MCEWNWYMLFIRKFHSYMRGNTLWNEFKILWELWINRRFSAMHAYHTCKHKCTHYTTLRTYFIHISVHGRVFIVKYERLMPASYSKRNKEIFCVLFWFNVVNSGSDNIFSMHTHTDTDTHEQMHILCGIFICVFKH